MQLLVAFKNYLLYIVIVIITPLFTISYNKFKPQVKTPEPIYSEFYEKQSHSVNLLDQNSNKKNKNNKILKCIRYKKVGIFKSSNYLQHKNPGTLSTGTSASSLQ